MGLDTARLIRQLTARHTLIVEENTVVDERRLDTLRAGGADVMRRQVTKIVSDSEDERRAGSLGCRQCRRPHPASAGRSSGG